LINNEQKVTNKLNERKAKDYLKFKLENDIFIIRKVKNRAIEESKIYQSITIVLFSTPNVNIAKNAKKCEQENKKFFVIYYKFALVSHSIWFIKL